jgi:SAM-dependent methyltransferase
MATIILENLLNPAGLVADIGCGMARMAFELELGAWPGCYLGLDLSYRLLIEAQRAFTGETGHIRLTDTGAGGLRTRLVPIQPPKLPPDRYTLALGDSAHLPLPDQSCAAVVALNLIDRVADPIAVTHELWRCVAPDGLLVLSDPFQWRDRPPEQRIYSFDPLTCDLENAVEVHLPPDLPHAPFALRDRASREISIHDNATALYRRTR